MNRRSFIVVNYLNQTHVIFNYLSSTTVEPQTSSHLNTWL